MKFPTNIFQIAAFCTAVAFASCNGNTETTTTSDSTTTEVVENDPPPPVADTASRAVKDDAEFCAKAAESNMAELDLLKSAATHTKNAELLKGAKDMIADHEKMGNAMKAYAVKKKYMLPAMASEDQREDLMELNKKTGTEWEKEYLNLLVDGHKDAVDLFEDNEGDRQDPELNKMITDNLPVLRMHRDMVVATEDRMD